MCVFWFPFGVTTTNPYVSVCVCVCVCTSLLMDLCKRLRTSQAAVLVACIPHHPHENEKMKVVLEPKLAAADGFSGQES